MKKVHVKLKSSSMRISILATTIALMVSSCGNDRGGVIVDASGEAGGGTQPGGGGFAFVILFLVITGSVLGMFAMDRIKKNKNQSDSDDQ